MITRIPGLAARQRYDLAVVGGGILGAQLALEAVRRGHRVLLLEKGDFGSGASGNSLRILHGGLRYLQSLDLVRFRESVAERRWYARQFPALVEPMASLMPLYRQGLKRRSIMRIALAMNDRLSRDRNEGVPDAVHLPAGEVLSAQGLRARFPSVRGAGLEGAARWYDYRMASSERVLIEILHWACSLGLQALNYVEADRIIVERGRVAGITALDRLSGERYRFECERVCNCTGSGARAFATANDRDHERLFVPSLAFNVLFDCEPQSADALAVAAPDAGAPVYFLCPTPFGLFAGTEHVGRPADCREARVSDGELAAFTGRINRAIPGINLGERNVRHVFCGLLPVQAAGSTQLTVRDAFVDHGNEGGPKGLFSATGIKYTTSHKVGASAADRIFGSRADAAASRAPPREPVGSAATPELLDGARVAAMDTAKAVNMIREVAAMEAVHSVEDFCLRRTNWIFSAPDYAFMERLVATALVPQINARARGAVGN